MTTHFRGSWTEAITRFELARRVRGIATAFPADDLSDMRIFTTEDATSPRQVIEEYAKVLNGLEQGRSSLPNERSSRSDRPKPFTRVIPAANCIVHMSTGRDSELKVVFSPGKIATFGITRIGEINPCRPQDVLLAVVANYGAGNDPCQDVFEPRVRTFARDTLTVAGFPEFFATYAPDGQFWQGLKRPRPRYRKRQGSSR